MASMATSTEKPAWETKGQEKQDTVRRMFAEIALRYDLLNSVMSLARHRRWRSFAASLLRLQPGQSALDVCCGTGDFLYPLRRAVGSQGKVLGVDFCLPMLEKAREKQAPGGLALGDAGRLPIRSSSVHGVSVGWGIRNVPDPDLAHRELFRVLRPGGRFVSVDMALPRLRFFRWASRLATGRLLPLLGGLFGAKEAYTYLPKSTETFLSREQLAASMEAAGFREIGWKDFLFGNICVHWGTKP
jgi:demethylmenaquinone methyltransferase / 2-methoxy-6-polyprenyl-1,4-benzoquinol methylase